MGAASIAFLPRLGFRPVPQAAFAGERNDLLRSRPFYSRSNHINTPMAAQ
jgi:hypothetical protein